MKLVVCTAPNTIELNWTWLPTWIGLNNALRAEIGQELEKAFLEKLMTEEVLQAAHDMVVELLAKKFEGLEGLEDYLDSIKFVVPR